MNEKFSLHKISFEWDKKKAATNFRKHGIVFENACEVFFDPFVSCLDEEVVNGEVRVTIIGMTSTWQVLYVVYVFHNEVIRIVSARLVTNTERKFYEDQ